MATWSIHTVVEYVYNFEADTKEEAIAEGWKYEDYSYNAQVSEINVSEVDDDEDSDED